MAEDQGFGGSFVRASRTGLNVFNMVHTAPIRLHLSSARRLSGHIHRYIPIHFDVLDLLVLGHALAAGDGKHICFLTVKQRTGPCHVVDFGGRADHRIHQPRIGVHADVALHP